MIALILGLFSILAVSLFLAKIKKCSLSGMPLVAICIAIIWFSIFGMLNLLVMGGVLWYIACLASLAWCIFTEKKQLLVRITPAFILFSVASLFFIVLFAVTQPMFSQWDEFTFWGAACKIVKDTNQLYTVAQSNLIARSYQPGLIVFSYMMQFFGSSFMEYGVFAAFAILYLASFAAASTLWAKTKAGTILVFSVFCAFPFLFTGYQAGVANFSYMNCMADTALACLFGGILCFYFSSKEKTGKSLAMTGILLAALTNVKDIGLALAGIAWFIIFCDIVFCEYKNVMFCKLRKWKACIVYGFYSLVCIFIPFFAWSKYVLIVTQQDRSNLGSGGSGGMSQMEMLITGMKALFRIQPDAVFDDRAAKMVQGFFGKYDGQITPNFQLWLFGSAFRMLLFILVVLAAAWVLSNKPLRKQILVFTITSLVGVLAFGIFLTFTYTYVFKGGESETLKDYARYTMPYWFGWLMIALVLLGKAALQRGEESKQILGIGTPLIAKSGVLVVGVFILAIVLMRTNWQASVLNVSPSFYTERISVQQVVLKAKDSGMDPDDRVYIISQGDNATRFYMFSYELADEKVVPLYKAPTEENDWRVEGVFPDGTTAASLVPAGEEGGYKESAVCTAEDLVAYLKAVGATHILLDVSDGYIQKEFSPLFFDELEGWGEDGQYEGGNRYYEIVWQGDTATFMPVYVSV